MEISEVVQHFGVSEDMLSGRVYVVKTLDFTTAEIEVPPHQYNISSFFSVTNVLSIVRRSKIEILAIGDEGDTQIIINDPEGLLIDGIGV